MVLPGRVPRQHNFMMSPKGRENFKHQLQQIVGSIQYTNDIDVHVALITAPSYAKEKAEKYFTKAKTNHQIIRQFIDLFGFFQKSPNAMVTAHPPPPKALATPAERHLSNH